MSDVDVSLVVPSYRRALHLPVLFEALRRQDFEGRWEAIIVLDGILDDTREVIEKCDDLPVRGVAFEENRGRSAALNAGFDAACGRVLVRCDDDLEPHRTYLREHVAAHAGPDPAGAIGVGRKHGFESTKPDANGLQAKVWNATVGALAHNGTMARFERCTRVAERLLGVIHRKVDVKRLAVLVEAAAPAG